MTDPQKLIRDLDTLTESIREDWKDLSKMQLSSEERADIRHRIARCLMEMQYLLGRLEKQN